MYNRNNKKEEKTPKVEIDMGKFVNSLPKEQLEKAQKLKTIFMLLSTLFFAISLFLPVEGRSRVSDIVWLSTLYIMFDIALIVFSVYVSYQGSKNHRIREEVPYIMAPRGGFKQHTYWSMELFNVFHIALLAAEIAVATVLFGLWGIINIFVIALSTAFSIASRQFLFRANNKTTTYLPPITPDQLPDEDAYVDAVEVVAKPPQEEDQKSEKPKKIK